MLGNSVRASLIIRTLNEAKHLGDLLKMVARQVTSFEVETVLIDSGSDDGTVEIANQHGAIVTTIAKSEFSFGRSLNRGCAFSTGDILVLVSGHCVPVDEHWLQNLCQPLIDGTVSYTYGRQIGDDNSNYAERRIFAKYFPATSVVPQDGFFCNNANAALLRNVWEQNPFDEDLTGLEDMELGKRLYNKGQKIGYVAEAPVFHHHTESWAQVRRRFEREALALRAIMPEVHLSQLDVARCILSSTLGDWKAASENGIKSTSRLDMLRYRWNQYIGSYKGNHIHRQISQKMKQRYFYPQTTQKVDKDEWLKPLHRTAPDEGQQPKS